MTLFHFQKRWFRVTEAGGEFPWRMDVSSLFRQADRQMVNASVLRGDEPPLGVIVPVIELKTIVRAPVERCFDLSRSVDLHVQSTSHTGERAIAGVTRGLLVLGDEVTWRARHFCIWQNLTSRMTQFERPHHFRDTMVRGAFSRFDHDHHFVEVNEGTEMRDVFDFTTPLGPLGRMVDVLVLKKYMTRFLEERNRILQRVAESDDWRKYLG